MSNPNQPSGQPREDLHAYLARKAAEAASSQEAAVETATAHFGEVEKAALTGLARIAEEARELPPQNRETLGPLWPGAANES